jgi:hypothetical protein
LPPVRGELYCGKVNDTTKSTSLASPCHDQRIFI